MATLFQAMFPAESRQLADVESAQMGLFQGGDRNTWTLES